MLTPGSPVWVVGLHRSGTSAMAGVLHCLGLHLGNRLIGYENRHGLGRGGFEAVGLARLCEASYPFPALEPVLPPGRIRAALAAWIAARRREARARGTLVAGKYPHLCFLVPLLLEVAPDSRFIAMQRPLDECIDSLVRRSTAPGSRLPATPGQCRALQKALWHARGKALAAIPAQRQLAVSYSGLRASPRREIVRVCRWLGLPATGECVERAVAHVQPFDGAAPG